jgi:4-deoxy-L-threo-5-hexosulose-uronate ketol-isomerase
MKTNYELRYSSHPQDAKHYDTARLRKEHLVEKIFSADEVNMVYTMYDRMVIGGAMPVKEVLTLETIDPLKSEFFLSRREFGTFNVGGEGKIIVDGKVFELGYKEALYLGAGNRTVTFESVNPEKPAKFYFNSAPAHKTFPDRKITKADAIVMELGSLETANHRNINKMLVCQVLETCQLQMGMTELAPGSVWNTMPAHVHSRRMEAYFYFEVPKIRQFAISWVKLTNSSYLDERRSAVISLIGLSTCSCHLQLYFYLGYGRRNLDYSDQDFSKIVI